MASTARAPLLVALALSLASGAIAKPSVNTAVVDRYPFEARKPGDGAPLVQVPDEVAEPLFLHLTKERFTVWWRARHACDKALRARPRLQGDRLTLVVEPQPRARPTTGACASVATVFETTVEGWGNGPRELRSEGAPPGIASLWMSAPSPSRPKEMSTLVDRVRERDALRRLGERIAWHYHAASEPRAALAAYRWLVSLDELHWRTPLYQARIFHNAAFTRSKGAALAALEALLPGVERLRERVSSEPPSEALDEMKRELVALEAFLEPALRYLALKWHDEALHRWHAPLHAYRAYLRLFPTSEHAPRLRIFYASGLLSSGDPLAAAAAFHLAASALDDDAQRLAGACALLIDADPNAHAALAPCRSPRPKTPSFAIFPRAAEERFARPPDLEE